MFEVHYWIDIASECITEARVAEFTGVQWNILRETMPSNLPPSFVHVERNVLLHDECAALAFYNGILESMKRLG